MEKRKHEDELEDRFVKLVTKCSFCDCSLIETKDSVKRSKLLECLHSVCEKCLSSWNLDDMSCPKCCLQVHKNKLLDNKILEELVDSETDPATICCSMHEAQVATHWCRECSDYICERCIENHQQLKVTKDHVIVLKMDHWKQRDKELGNFPCPIHPSEQLVIFCNKCNIMTCRDCQLATHREHSYDFVEKVIDQAKLDIYDMYKFLVHHQMVLDQAELSILHRKKKLLLRKQSLIKEIHYFTGALTEIINKRAQNLITRLEQMTANKVYIFDTNSQSLKKHLLPFHHTVEFVKNVLHSSSDPSIIYSKDHIMNHMKRIHYQKSAIPNVVRNLQLKFSSGDITNLMKELQSFGLISLNDEDSDGTAVTMAANNLGKALRQALAKQFAAASSGSVAAVHMGSMQPQPNVPQQTTPQQQQQLQGIQTSLQPELKIIPPVNSSAHQSGQIPQRMQSQDTRIYHPQWNQQTHRAFTRAPPPPYQQIMPCATTTVNTTSAPNRPQTVAHPRITSISVPPKVSWHSPEPPLQQRGTSILPQQSVMINKIRLPPQEDKQPLDTANKAQQTLPEDVIDLDAISNFYN